MKKQKKHIQIQRHIFTDTEIPLKNTASETITFTLYA